MGMDYDPSTPIPTIPTLPFDWIFGLDILGWVVLIVLVIVLGLIINTILLKIALSLFKADNTDFGDIFVTALIMALIGWIPIIGCILCWVIINSRHDTGFGKAILVWLIAGLIGIILTFLIIWGIFIAINFI